MGLFGKKKAKAEPVEDAEIVLDSATTVIAEPAKEPPKPAAKKRSHLAPTIGKAITLANLVIAILFLATSFFFHANKIQINARKSELDQITRELTQLQTDRQLVVDGLTQEIEAENKKLADLTQQNQKELGDLETAISETRRRIEEARKQQVELSEQSGNLHKDQEALHTEVVALRETLETNVGAEEGLTTDRNFLADRLAKTQNDLREANRRGDEIRLLLSP